MFFRKLRCSFCGRPDKEVNKLVAGPRVYICDRCAHDVMRIVESAPPAVAAKTTRPAVIERSVDWARTWHFAASVD